MEEARSKRRRVDENEKQEQKHNGSRELEEARPWGVLDGDNLELISSYLHPVDYIRFRAVCRTIRSVIPEVYRRRIIKNRYLSPWLVFAKNNGTTTIYNFVDPMCNNKNLIMNLPELLVGAKICFSKDGWLLMSKVNETQTIFFYNPFTRATIQLPDLPQGISFTNMSFSSSPTSSDCVVFGIHHVNSYKKSIFFITRGKRFWRSGFLQYVQTHMLCVNNPFFFDGVIYCLDDPGHLGILKLKNELICEILANPLMHFEDASFLVECDGKLLLVELGYLGKTIMIFRFDFSKMDWVKVESLGKHMLFISNTSCLSAIAPDISMGNKIYFPKLHGERILFYSLDTGRYHSIGSQHSAKDFNDTTEYLNCTWIEPNWSPTTEKELNWLSI